MDNLDQAVMNGNNISDEDDRRIFSVCSEGVIEMILRIKNNDPQVDESYLPSSINVTASKRLGVLIGNNVHLTKFHLSAVDFHLPELCDGLQRNRSIQEFSSLNMNLQGTERMNSLASCISNNPNLKQIHLQNCNITQTEIDILANSLLVQPRDSLEELSLPCNKFSNVDLDGLVEALGSSRNLREVSFTECHIGLKGCNSIANLLKDKRSNLAVIYLANNAIDDECVTLLVESLTANTKLRKLNLNRNMDIAKSGWMALLKLVCNISSIDNTVKDSNHSLTYIHFTFLWVLKRPFLIWMLTIANSSLHHWRQINPRETKEWLQGQRLFGVTAEEN